MAGFALISQEPDTPRSAEFKKMHLYSSTESLTIFYPAYNEDHYLERAVEAAEEVGHRMLKEEEISDSDILIVNDGSTDQTGSIAEALSSGNARVKATHHRANRGLGAALKTGFGQTSGDIILYTDVDLPFDIMDLLFLCR